MSLCCILYRIKSSLRVPFPTMTHQDRTHLRDREQGILYQLVGYLWRYPTLGLAMEEI